MSSPNTRSSKSYLHRYVKSYLVEYPSGVHLDLVKNMVYMGNTYASHVWQSQVESSSVFNFK